MGFWSSLFGSSSNSQPSTNGSIIDNLGQRWTKVQSNQQGKSVLAPVGDHRATGGMVTVVIGNSIHEVNANSVVFDDHGNVVSYSEIDYGGSCIG